MGNLKKEFGKLYDKYIDKIYRFIYFKVSSPEITEDLCSETFMKAWIAFRDRSLDKDGQKNKIKNASAFLYQIARNLVVDFYRKNNQPQVISTQYTGRIIDPRENLEEKANQSSEFSQVKKALTSIKEEYQEVIIWHYLDDLSISEIAKILEKSEGTVRVMLHRALKSLKKELS